MPGYLGSWGVIGAGIGRVFAALAAFVAMGRSRIFQGPHEFDRALTAGATVTLVGLEPCEESLWRVSHAAAGDNGFAVLAHQGDIGLCWELFSFRLRFDGEIVIQGPILAWTSLTHGHGCQQSGGHKE